MWVWHSHNTSSLSACHQASRHAVFLLQAFLASAKIQGAFQPPPAPPLQLTQLDQCRIRDRSTIMARHLFADRGDAYADEQACPRAFGTIARRLCSEIGENGLIYSS